MQEELATTVSDKAVLEKREAELTEGQEALAASLREEESRKEALGKLLSETEGQLQVLSQTLSTVLRPSQGNFCQISPANPSTDAMV